jgi:hypothetical protein
VTAPLPYRYRPVIIYYPLIKKSRLKPRFSSKTKMFYSLCSFYQGADALGAQHLTNLAAFLVDADRLQVGSERTGGCLVRPGSVTAEGRFLSTVCTDSHRVRSFPRTPLDFRDYFNTQKIAKHETSTVRFGSLPVIHASRFTFYEIACLESGPILPQNASVFKPGV